jgi:hypothetical protein
LGILDRVWIRRLHRDVYLVHVDWRLETAIARNRLLLSADKEAVPPRPPSQVFHMEADPV